MKASLERLRQLKENVAKNNELFRPEFIRFSEPGAAERFNALLDTPGITITDGIREQVKDLLKLREPSVAFTDEQLEEKVSHHFGDEPPEYYGVWVYYPWSRRLVHLLDRDEYIDVRTSRNTYKITREERDTLATKRIGVIGLSVGQSVSVTLAMERVCGELRLADFDTLELTNLNRIRTGVHNLGLPKVYAVAREISEIDPYLRVVCFVEGLHEGNIDEFFTGGGKLDLLVEESDGFDIKILSRYKARELHVPVIMEASDRCMVDVERFDLEPDRKILHGIVKHLDVATLKTLKTNDEKIPYMLDVLGFANTTARLRASMLEMRQTVTTWPQLASAVTMGGGITADVSRRILLNHFTDSGRYYVDVDELIGNRKHAPDDTREDFDKAPDAESMRREAKELGLAPSDATSDEIDEIVGAALLSPSLANRQPWKWLVCENNLVLFSDRSQQLHVLDRSGDAMIISLGCALENVVQQAAAMGLSASLRMLPRGDASPVVAAVTFKRDKKAHADLAQFISRRRTARGRGKQGTLDASIAKTIAGAAKGEKAITLAVITDASRVEAFCSIAAACERARLLDPGLHREYFSRDLHLNADSSGRGVRLQELHLPPAMSLALEVISDTRVAKLLRDWNKGSLFENAALNAMENSLAIGAIAVETRSREHLLRAGMLAERVWLTATKFDISFQPVYLPLAFSEEWVKKDAGDSKNFFDFSATGNRLSAVFDGLDHRKAVFLFRLFHSELPAVPSLRAPRMNLVYNC